MSRTVPLRCPNPSDPTILDACEFALREHAINKGDLVAAFLFGSRVKGFADYSSDVDLIFLLSSNSPSKDFQYQRIQLANRRIDSNVIKVPKLNELCQNDTDWAYRLHHARFIRELTPVSEAAAIAWEEKIDKLIESPEACRFRLIRHIRDCRSLLRATHNFPAGIIAYLLVEAIFLVPIIYLNGKGTVPYAGGHPWDEALTLSNRDDKVETQDYRELIATISCSQFFREMSSEDLFSRELKHVRERCRLVIESCCGPVFQSRQGAAIVSALNGNKEVQRRIAGLLPKPTSDGIEFRRAVISWLTNVRPKRLDQIGSHVRSPKLERRREKHTGLPRFVDYDPNRERLKVIIPTGGCRVPVCTFCMLPLLARPKSDITKILSMMHKASQGSLRQVAVYTDGSFFDDHELNDLERMKIASFAKESGAEELLVESRPLFLKPKVIGKVVDTLQPNCRLRIGIGVQSTAFPIRRHITSTPVAQSDLLQFLNPCVSRAFSVRIFLIANKPLMTATEDRLDLLRSLEWLNEHLANEDTVTINPLLPTHGTFLEGLWEKGYWRPLTRSESKMLEAELSHKEWRFHFEFGPYASSTCTDVILEPTAPVAKSTESSRVLEEEISSNSFPWALLGSAKHRRAWANSSIIQNT